MVLNILCLGDAHFQTSNTIEMSIYLTKIETYIQTNINSIDIIINMGDNLHDHSRLHVTPLNMAVKYIKMLASYKPTYVVVGNHDAYSNSIFLTTEHWCNCLKGLKNIEIVDDVLLQTIKNQKITLCPYVTDGRFVEALNTKQGEWEDSRCIFSHVTIKGAQMGSMVAKDADEWDENNPMLISGHIHGSHWLGSNMYYTGSIIQVAIDESPKKHIVLVKIDDTNVKIEEIDLGLPKKKIIHIDIEDVDDYKVPDEQDTKYILYVSGTCEDFRAFIKSNIYKTFIKLPQIYRGSKGIKFKPKKLLTKTANERLKNLNECKLKHFNDILLETIKQDEDSMLFSFYRHLVLEEDEDLSNMFNQVLTFNKVEYDQ
jgi:DNA repair exonuclease SbcCD nuclease subunit